jgi:tetratricopeptide (TPR) repeat protein
MTDGSATGRWSQVRALFEQALDVEPDERLPWLVARCDDEAVRCEVTALLDEQTALEAGFIEPPVLHGDHGPPAQVGAYHLLELLGSGGMGTVYAAEQHSPRRRVALKLLNEGLTSRSARQRFAYEAEILARLRHPAIAQVYEAGVAADPVLGERPWIAMEYVDGAVTILQAARERRLGRDERLAMFLTVCDAIQHGHARGVIHRDIKAANLLVDSNGAPKVIDFGVARSLSSDRSAAWRTRPGQIIGSLGAMSPEQLSGDPDAVDVRSDVYALGVVLHELLCDRPPHDLTGLTLVEAARRVQEQPARRASALDPSLAGDLEWILACALEIDPERRYASAGALAADLRRHLAHETILAGPPSAITAVRKYVRRHRLGVAAAALVVLALCVGLSVALVQRREAQRQARRAGFVSEFLLDTLSSPDPSLDGRDVRVIDVLGRAAASLEQHPSADPRDQALLQGTLARTYHALGLYDDAVRHAEQAWARLSAVAGPEDADWRQLQISLAGSLIVTGALDRAVELLREVLAAAEDLGVEALDAETRLVDALRARGELEAAQTLGRSVLERARATRPDAVPSALAALSATLFDLGDLRTAEGLQREELAAREAGSGPQSADAVAASQRLARSLLAMGRLEEARALIAHTLARLEELLGPRHPFLLTTLDTLAVIQDELGHYEAAEALQGRTVDLLQQTLGADHDRTLTALDHLGGMLQRHGDLAASEALHRDVLTRRLASVGEDQLKTLMAMSNLASVLRQRGRLDEAEGWGRRAWEQAVERHGATHPTSLSIAHTFGQVLLESGRAEEAVRLLHPVVEAHELLGEAGSRARLRSQTVLARALRAQGRLPEAARLFREVLDEERALLTPSDLERLATAVNLSEILVASADQGDAREAVELLSEVLAHHPAGVSSSSLVRLTALGNLALAQHRLGALDRALPLVDEAADGLLQAMGEDHPNTIQVVGNRDMLLASAVRGEQLLPAIDAALAHPDAAYHRRSLHWHWALADAGLEQGETERSFALYEQTLRRWQRLEPEPDPPDAEAWHERRALLAAAYSGRGRVDDARRSYGAYIDEALARGEVQDAGLARVRVAHGACLFQLDRHDEARQALSVALPVLDAEDPEDQPFRQVAIQLLEQLAGQDG